MLLAILHCRRRLWWLLLDLDFNWSVDGTKEWEFGLSWVVLAFHAIITSLLWALTSFAKATVTRSMFLCLGGIDHELLPFFYEMIVLLPSIKDCISIPKVRASKDNLVNIQRNYSMSYFINIPLSYSKFEGILFGDLQPDAFLNPIEMIRMWMRLGLQP